MGVAGLLCVCPFIRNFVRYLLLHFSTDFYDFSADILFFLKSALLSLYNIDPLSESNHRSIVSYGHTVMAVESLFRFSDVSVRTRRSLNKRCGPAAALALLLIHILALHCRRLKLIMSTQDH